MDLSRPPSPFQSRLATTTSISCDAVSNNKNSATNRFSRRLETFEEVLHVENKAGLPHIFSNTPAPTRQMTDSLAQRIANTKSKTLFDRVREQLALIQETSEQTDCENSGELALIHALIDDLTARLIHYRKIEDEHFNPGLYHSQITEYRRKEFKLKDRNSCSWKMVLIWPIRRNVLPPATQAIPDLRVTDHHGNVYRLEEVLPDLETQEFNEHIRKRKTWGIVMEEYLHEKYGADPAWRHARKMHFERWEEGIEDNNEEEIQMEETELERTTEFIPMDTIWEEPDDDETDEHDTTEYESSDDNTSFKETFNRDVFIDRAPDTRSIIYKADLATIRRFAEAFDTHLQKAFSRRNTSFQKHNLEAMTKEETRQGKGMQGVSERFENLLKSIGRKFTKQGK